MIFAYSRDASPEFDLSTTAQLWHTGVTATTTVRVGFPYLLARKISVIFVWLTGPHTWAEHYVEAGGNRQSPIDIETDNVTLDPKLSSRQLNWTWPKDTADVTNTGYCWKAHVHGHDSVLEGGPLKDKYQLEQYHCHWGVDDSQGSEHTVDGRSYAAEVYTHTFFLKLHLFYYVQSIKWVIFRFISFTGIQSMAISAKP